MTLEHQLVGGVDRQVVREQQPGFERFDGNPSSRAIRVGCAGPCD